MEDIFLARQPIYDLDLNVAAYEMLYRSGEQSTTANVFDGDQATSTVLMNLFAEIGHETVTSSKPAFINLTRNFLLGDMAISFPKDKLVIEVLEDIAVDDELISHVVTLKDEGYKIALDDFVYTDEWEPLVKIADYIKIDVQELEGDALKATLDKVRSSSATLLAEKIETQEMFDMCKELGFELFQGYFLCKPKILKGQQAPANKMVVLNLLAKLQNIDTPTEEISQLLSQDASLTVKLLRILNSSFYSLSREITSIQEAIVLLGRKQISNLAHLILLTKLSDKPQELMHIGMQRAKHCEKLAVKMGVDNPDAYFTVGLLSIVDALLDQNIGDIISEIPLSPEVKEALINQKGSIGDILKNVLSYEKGDWQDIHSGKLNQHDYQESYVEAIQWTNETCDFLEAESRR